MVYQMGTKMHCTCQIIYIVGKVKRFTTKELAKIALLVRALVCLFMPLLNLVLSRGGKGGGGQGFNVTGP